jgi:hypothetical protein
MLELFFVVVSFIAGRQIGINQANQTLVSLAVEDSNNRLYQSEQKAETWERRYNNLLSSTQVSFEE